MQLLQSCAQAYVQAPQCRRQERGHLESSCAAGGHSGAAAHAQEAHDLAQVQQLRAEHAQELPACLLRQLQETATGAAHAQEAQDLAKAQQLRAEHAQELPACLLRQMQETATGTAHAWEAQDLAQVQSSARNIPRNCQHVYYVSCTTLPQVLPMRRKPKISRRPSSAARNIPRNCQHVYHVSCRRLPQVLPMRRKPKISRRSSSSARNMPRNCQHVYYVSCRRLPQNRAADLLEPSLSPSPLICLLAHMIQHSI